MDFAAGFAVRDRFRLQQEFLESEKSTRQGAERGGGEKLVQ